MTNGTEFSRIKQAVDNKKREKIQAETRTDSLEKEEKRLFAEAEELAGKPIRTIEEMDAVLDELKSGIENGIQNMKTILDEEGVSY